jgi:uncharacterized membrane protein
LEIVSFDLQKASSFSVISFIVSSGKIFGVPFHLFANSCGNDNLIFVIQFLISWKTDKLRFVNSKSDRKLIKRLISQKLSEYTLFNS